MHWVSKNESNTAVEHINLFVLILNTPQKPWLVRDLAIFGIIYWGDGIRENGTIAGPKALLSYHQSHVVSGATSSPCLAQVVSFLAAVYDIDKAKENKRKSKR